jgi:hypothetical protein
MKRIWQQELTIAVYILIGCMFCIAMFALESKYFGFVGLGFLFVAIGCKRRHYPNFKISDIDIHKTPKKTGVISVWITTTPGPDLGMHKFVRTPDGIFKQASDFRYVALYKKDDACGSRFEGDD